MDLFSKWPIEKTCKKNDTEDAVRFLRKSNFLRSAGRHKLGPKKRLYQKNKNFSIKKRNIESRDCLLRQMSGSGTVKRAKV